MKKTLLAVLVALTVGFAGYQIAGADPGWGGGMGGPGYGNGYCQNYYGGPGGGQGLDKETIAKRNKFFDETTDLRKQLVVKRAELKALMHQDNPDEKKVANLTGEMFDLRNQLRKKAEESGIQGGFGLNYCDGPGMGHRHGRRGDGPRGW